MILYLVKIQVIESYEQKENYIKIEMTHSNCYVIRSDNDNNNMT